MPKFGKRSKERLAECHHNLQRIMHELIKELDVTILCGHRTKEEQDSAFEAGNSQVKFPNSKHNSLPSKAVDVAPYPVVWEHIGEFEDMCDRIEIIAKRLGIKVRMGRYFSFKDYPHVELLDEPEED